MTIAITLIDRLNTSIVFQHALPIFCKLIAQGAQLYVVGGAIRDAILNIPLKDIDIEVHRMSAQQLEEILSEFGIVRLIGKQFGVFRIDHLNIDWSLPRTDSQGRRPIVTIDTQLSIENALRRRDITINAIALDLQEKKLIDPYGGLTDLQECVARAVDPKLFVEDPLRVLRVMQFVSRFGLTPDHILTNVCRTVSLVNVSSERIGQEFFKLMQQSVKAPSRGIRWLHNIGQLQSVAPILALLDTIPQSPQWHPEGSVLEHSLQALDAACMHCPEPVQDQLLIRYTALCHDIGKASTTIETSRGYSSKGHAAVGAKQVVSILPNIGAPRRYFKSIQKLIYDHMAPGLFVRQQAKEGAFRRLAARLGPETNIHTLYTLAYADHQGRDGNGNRPLTNLIADLDLFAEKSKSYMIWHHAPQPMISAEILQQYGLSGKTLGDMLRKAYIIQLNNPDYMQHTILQELHLNKI